MNRTKEAISAAFQELLEERPLNKITVKDIVERCGVNRNTFYYHFEDIPSLLEHTLKYNADQIIAAYSKVGSVMDCVTPFVEYCTAHKRAILHIYRAVRREAFQDHLSRLAIYTVEQYINAAAGDRFGQSEKQQRDKALLVRYFKCTLVGVILDWLDAGMEYDLLSATERMCQLMEGAIERAFERCFE